MENCMEKKTKNIVTQFFMYYNLQNNLNYISFFGKIWSHLTIPLYDHKQIQKFSLKIK